MITIPDFLRLSEISIPGTHDSMAFRSNLPFRDVVRTQTMDLEEQLLSGIRYLDIRVSYEGDYFKCRHGAIDLGYNFEDVLKIIQEYLSNYPTETIIMRFKQEHTSATDSEMLELFNKYYDKYKDLFWDIENSENKDNPYLKELRGKICLLSDVHSIKNGINYSKINKQDNYHLASNWELYLKWEAIKNHIDNSENGDENKIMMNYTSASGGAFPYFVASGHSTSSTYGVRLATGLTEPGFKSYYPDFPRTGKIGVFSTILFEGTNTLTADYLNNKSIKRSGIVVSDFPGERLINEIIQCNYRY